MSFTDRLTLKNRALEYFMVIAIVVLAVAVSFVALSAILAQARDTERISDIATLRNALELYYLDHGAYPQSKGESEWAKSADASWDALGQLLRPYLSAMPRDPINEPTDPLGRTSAFNYSYYSAKTENAGARGDYILVFRLEKPDHASEYQEADVGLVTARGRMTFLPLTRADGVYVVRAPQ